MCIFCLKQLRASPGHKKNRAKINTAQMGKMRWWNNCSQFTTIVWKNLPSDVLVEISEEEKVLVQEIKWLQTGKSM